MDDCRNPGGGRFVILRHEMPATAARSSHWDLMVENRGVLLTWEFSKLPPGPLPATFKQLGIHRLANHRIDYLEYEGPVSNGRGTVQQVERGTYQLVNEGPEGVVKVKAKGRHFQIELSVPMMIFQQTDEPILNEGELIQFLDLSEV